MTDAGQSGTGTGTIPPHYPGHANIEAETLTGQWVPVVQFRGPDATERARKHLQLIESLGVISARLGSTKEGDYR